MRCRRSIPFVLGTVAFGLTNCGHAAGLFLPVARASVPAEVAPAMPKAASVRRSTSRVPDAWERRVRVARHELVVARDDVEDTGAGRLLLNVKDGVHLNVVVERTAPTKWGYSLSGRVADGEGGFVTLVVHEEAVAGSIWTPDVEYRILPDDPRAGGVHTLRQVSRSRSRVECGGVRTPKLAADKRQQSVLTGVDGNTVVDVLVVWTPAAEHHWRGESLTRFEVDLAVAATNDALDRSGALVRLNLVAAERVDYQEEGIFTDLDRLILQSDGHMDDVHARRDIVGADLVGLFGRFRGDFARGVASDEFVAWADDWSVFAHEVGHIFDVLHERQEPALGPHTYNHGFVDARNCATTIMAYGDRCGVFVPYFASPTRYDSRDGRPLGASRFGRIGREGPADAVLTINRSRHRVASFRPSVPVD